MKEQRESGQLLKFLLLVSIAASTVLPAGADQQLVFSVKSHSVRSGKTAAEFKSEKSGKEKDKPVVTDSSYIQTITLGESYVLANEDGEDTIFDFALGCMYILAKKEKKYTQVDLHALLYFRIMEYMNREQIGKVLRAVGAADAGHGDGFALQSLFGIDNPAAAEKIKAEEKTVGKTTSFSYGGVERAACTQSTTSIEAPFKRSYNRALAQLFKIHPSVRTSMLAMNVPQVLKYWYEDSIEKRSYEYELKESKSVPGSRPLPPGDFSQAYPEELQPVIAAFSRTAAKAEVMEKDRVCETVDSLRGKQEYLEALLTLLEYTLATGDQMTPELRRLSLEIQNDSECKKFLRDFGPKEKKEDVKKCLEALESIDRKKLKKAYVIDIMRANNYEALGELSKSRELMVSVLLQQPRLTGVYHDLGMNYLKRYEMPGAWMCFNLADKIFPDFPMMREVHRINRDMESRFPEYF